MPHKCPDCLLPVAMALELGKICTLPGAIPVCTSCSGLGYKIQRKFQ